MSGLETVASFIAICTASCQIFSSLCDIIRDLKTVPKELDDFKQETKILQRSVEQVIRLANSHDENLRLFDRFGLQDAILTCAKACEGLHRLVARWKTYPVHSRRAQVQAWYYKTEIHQVRGEVSSAREVAVFALNSVQLHLLIRSSMPSSEQLRKIQQTKVRLWGNDSSSNRRQGPGIAKNETRFQEIDLETPREDQDRALVIANQSRSSLPSPRQHASSADAPANENDERTSFEGQPAWADASHEASGTHTRREAESPPAEDSKVGKGDIDAEVGKAVLRGSDHVLAIIHSSPGGGNIRSRIGNVETDRKSRNISAFNINHRKEM